MPEKTIQVLFELAINWETQARDLYANFTNLFQVVPCYAIFFQERRKTRLG